MIADPTIFDMAGLLITSRLHRDVVHKVSTVGTFLRIHIRSFLPIYSLTVAIFAAFLFLHYLSGTGPAQWKRL